jgi:hypothetical protein
MDEEKRRALPRQPSKSPDIARRPLASFSALV